jgi:hypothetical protein
VCLHHAYTIIIVDDQTREVITFAMDEAIAVSGDCPIA